MSDNKPAGIGIEPLAALPLPVLMKHLRDVTLMLDQLNKRSRHTVAGQQMNIADRARMLQAMLDQKNAVAQAALMIANSAVIESAFLVLIDAVKPVLAAFDDDKNIGYVAPEALEALRKAMPK